MMNASLELGYHSNQEHNRKYFKKPSEKVYNIYLSEEELKKINETNLTKASPIKISDSLYLTPDRLERARDLFLISAYTGLRVSDFNRLEQKNIIESKGKKYFQIQTQKNSKKLTIPINSIVLKILTNRMGELPKRMPDQHINYALKEIGKLANIDNEEIVKRTQGREKIEITYKKYELISNHTGRRSFCTNAYLSGMPTIDIMAISGHSTERVFYNYIKVNHLEKAQKIAEHKFFQ